MAKYARQNGRISPKMFLLFAALAFGDALVCDTADHATENRGYPEEPELLDGSAANEHGHGSRAGRVHGGVGHRDRDEVNEREAETDCDWSKACRSAAIGSAHDHEQEDSCEHGFDEECGEHARGLAAKGVQAVLEGIGPAVGSEGADASVGEVGACYCVKQGCCNDTANHLGGDVGRSFLSREAAACNLTERNSRVQVATGNVANRISHGEHGKAEGEGHAHVADTSSRDAAGENSCTAAAKHKPERADSFGNGASRKFHLIFSILRVGG